MSKKIYRAGIGAWFGNDKAQVYGERLEELGSKENITAERVVDDAKSKSSPLHNAFEWDDTVEANKWRLHKARLLMNFVELEIVVSKEETKYVQANISLKSQKGYIPVIKVLNNADMRMELIGQALDEVDSWQKKYQEYRELSDIFTGIETAKKKLK